MYIYFLIFSIVYSKKENLVRNPSFEFVNNKNYPLEWNIVAEGGISSDSFSGKNSFHWKVTNTKLILSQFIDYFEKGFRYKVCAAFKLINVKSFKIYIQNRNYTYETTSSNEYSGTNNWEKKCFMTHHLTLKTGKYSLGFVTFAQEGQGEIFLDDISIYRIDEFLLLGINNDRDEVFDTINIVYQINTTRGNYSLSDWELTIKIKDNKNHIYYENTGQPVSSFYEYSLNISYMGLKDNNFYSLEGTLKGLNDDVIEIYSYPFKKVSKIFKRKIELDKYGRMFYNGELFFPFGIYMLKDNKIKFLEYINRTHLNVIISNLIYSEMTWLEETFKGRIKIIRKLNYLYTLNHSTCQYYNEEENYNQFIYIVNIVKKHPILMGWYINDEIHSCFHEVLRNRTLTIHELDKDHPSYTVTNRSFDANYLSNTTDMIGLDKYPIGLNPIRKVYESNRETFDNILGQNQCFQ